ncbi:MAG: hypothetical protein OEW96_00325 [Betaproteobacteria bacterium]|nr:hypothetical protein [Betaproteobacteria bacterium]MDH5210106.1 hypothetical protein [Betaproteobacteria bacterium]
MRVSVLKPGLLVSLKTTVSGAVDYERTELEAEHVTADGSKVARWETLRNIPDPLEFDRATKARGLARSAVVSVCCSSSFGLLCPSDKEAELQAALTDAQRIVNDFNMSARRARVQVFVLMGRVADNDVEAARAIGAELRELMESMQAGIKAADPEAIREAATKARAIGGMLSEDAGRKVSEAIAQARKVARELVKRVQNAGEQAAVVVAQCNVEAIERARFAFLDLDANGQPVESIAAPARGLDLPPAGEKFAPPMSAATLPFDLEA